MTIKAIDLFCGIGGLTHGLVKEDIPVIAGFDIDTSCKFAYEANNNAKFIDKDVSDITKKELDELYGDTDIKILVGCAPCQPFSTYTKNKDKRKDQKWALLYKFRDIIQKVKPEIISMENVPQVKKHDVYKDFILSLKEEGYEVNEQVVYCPDYGIPQSRKRLVLLASKLGKIEIIEKTHKKENYVTVRDTIEKLQSIEDGVASILDPLHYTRKLSELNKKRVRSSVPGGTWNDWDEELILECHKKKGGKTFSSVYGRMVWDEPSPTMTTQCIGLGNGRFGHPTQDRAISLREAALFQTFPNEYKFIEDYSKPFRINAISRQIGNAVPVDLGKVVAKSIKKHLNIA